MPVIPAGDETSTADLIAEARRIVHGRTRSMRNKLESAINATTDTVVCSYDVSHVPVGSVICIDLEILYVVARTSASNTLTVLRAEDGSTAAAHDADATIWVNPRFTDFAIFQEMNNELDFLSSPNAGLYQVAGLNIAYNSSRRGYNLTDLESADVLDVYDVSFKQNDGSYDYTRLRGFRLERDLDTDDFASGMALFLDECAEPGQNLRVRYRKRFEHLTAADNDVADVTGLHAEALRILPLGAAWRLVARDETRRNNPDPQGETRRAEEVASGAILRSAAALKAERDSAVEEERARLSRRYPVRL